MASPNLPLSGIVTVSVYVSPQSALPPSFNVGLIIGNSQRIPSTGPNSRVVTFTSLASMITYGFLNTDPEYLAAELYFSQAPAPLTLQVGCQDPTAITGGTLDAAGTGYAVGDTGTISGGTAGKLATYQVLTLSGSGVATFSITRGGTGYTAAVGAATTATTGSGTGFTITTTGDVGETPLIAVQQCRIASSLWYACMVTTAVTADAEALAAYLQANASPPSFYFHTTHDTAVLNGQSGNLGAYCSAASYTRIFIDYATTQSGTYPNNAYACAASMGVMMGLNTGLAGSYFTMKFKVLTGIVAEPLTANQIATIEAQGVNLYLGYQGPYTILEQGTTPVQYTFADQVLNLDMLTSTMQINVMNLLTEMPSVPQTNVGEAQLIAAVNQACQAAVVRGYLAPGTWDGPQIVISSTVGIYPGDPVPAGYKTMAPNYSTQSPANRQARQAMPIYCAITPAGAVHSLAIGVYVSL
jgi:hypothetical protein